MEREFWIKHSRLVPRPTIAASNSLPSSLVHHLINCKSSDAVRQKRGHQITPLQGACHSLVVPIVFPVFLSGLTDFRDGKHILKPLPAGESPVAVVSALVQPDFEFESVMYKMIQLQRTRVDGVMLDKSSKDISDEDLKRNLVYHFTSERSLPAADCVSERDWAASIYYRSGTDVLSLEMLRGIVNEMIRVECAALTVVAKRFNIRLFYTWDPPSIFAKCFDLKILESLWLEAITRPGVLNENFVGLAYNDYANDQMIYQLQKALPNRIIVCRKSEYSVQPGQIRVLHTNSDAFAEHTRTQPLSTSLDGAIGASTSVAASLYFREPYPIMWI